MLGSKYSKISRQSIIIIFSICNRMGPRQLRINFTCNFKVFTKLPESQSDEGHLENFENTSEMNP